MSKMYWNHIFAHFYRLKDLQEAERKRLKQVQIIEHKEPLVNSSESIPYDFQMFKEKVNILDVLDRYSKLFLDTSIEANLKSKVDDHHLVLKYLFNDGEPRGETSTSSYKICKEKSMKTLF